jgi:hypothetical protein
MSESLGLGDADAGVRWIGIRRHQALLVVVGLGLTSAWILAKGAPIAELGTGEHRETGAGPMGDGRTLGEWLGVAARYLGRSRWSDVTVREWGDDVVVWTTGEVAFRAYELDHRGRLDLSGRDVALAQALAALADAASASSENRHISQHVLTRDGATATVLALPSEVPAPEGWRPHNARALEAIGVDDSSTLSVYERFGYLRTSSGLVRIFRVRDFSSVPDSRSLLEHLLRVPVDLDLSVHVDVVSGAKSHRLAARAVHRVRSDEATSSAAGFRRSARSSRSFERLAQREVLVANGRALMRLGVFVVVRGATLEELQLRSTAVWRRAHDGGLRLERGRGRQGGWFRAQLPGGAEW